MEKKGYDEVYNSFRELEISTKELGNEEITRLARTIRVHFELDLGIYAETVCKHTGLVYQKAANLRKKSSKEEHDISEVMKNSDKLISQVVTHFEKVPFYRIEKLTPYLITPLPEKPKPSREDSQPEQSELETNVQNAS